MQTEWLLPPHERTVPAILRRQEQLFGHRPCVTISGAAWRHGDLARVAACRAGALRVAGIKRGDRVAIMCSNRSELLETILGCSWIGAIAVPINSACMGPQIEYLLADSDAQLLVIECQFVERLQAVDVAKTSLKGVWEVGSAHGTTSSECSALPARRWPEPAEPIEAAPVLPSDVFAVLYTSGTTGPSKGVLCSHAHYYWWGANTADILGHTQDDVLCTTLPLFHINALHMFLQAAIVGCEAHYLGKFSASGFWPAMVATKATVIYLLGAMVPFLLAQPQTAQERNHNVRIGLGPGVPEAAGKAFLERTGVLMLEGYGATESNFVIAASRDAPPRGVMGWVRPGFDARVVDEHDNPVPEGQAGELVLRADEPFAFASGYLGKPDKTVEAWRNLWFHTGDRVVREADGAFRFIDRIKDAIRRRGENISSWEVEQVLLSHPGIAACAVYPVRSEHAEDEVMAAVVGKTGHSPDPRQIATFCESRLQKFAVPRFIDIVAELPRTENGKVQKYILRERGIPAGCWDLTLKA
ncbi:ATP-dependent acyl-CoA ligase [Variovorax sp. WS11]|uniref:ATP-dependent acyl-CoA ligase n=1 Tax=Variovorax sp. WS11 TaxID=1105204 RepID=UPI000D0D06C8|nr:ATP-dependent acyl-CoA ligase [Variovorax sp. WS11]NDZ18759.1 AMP-binding protein [Variovorax sp. WS11]PSL82538.1 ATP-dependent acyl-CoA ligase [Variovorax sp. WS11]